MQGVENQPGPEPGSFESMGIHPDILKGIQAYGLETPAYVQKHAIVPLIDGRDAIIQAQSGMGKTAALVISILQRLDRKEPRCQALIMVNTRELAPQLEKVIRELSKFMKHPKPVTTYCCTGGSMDLLECKVEVKRSQIIIGTNWRTKQMILGGRKGPYLDPKHIKIFALDEADSLLDNLKRGTDKGKDLGIILEKIPEPAQKIFVAATIPHKTLQYGKGLLKEDPFLFLYENPALVLEGIQQFYVAVNDKISVLKELHALSQIAGARGMIFCNTKDCVTEVRRVMGNKIPCISGDLPQQERNDIMRKFTNGVDRFRILITSDLLGRGIDIQQINLVINYDIPEFRNKEQYIHRIGRAGRHGRKGIAISLVNENEKPQFDRIQGFFQTEVKEMPSIEELKKLLNEGA